MGLFFRKRLSLFNLIHFSLTGAGLGVSLGVRGLRAGISSSGRPYFAAYLPGTGLYLRQFAHAHHSAPMHVIAPPSAFAIPHPLGSLPQPHGFCYAVGYIVGWAMILSPVAVIAWYITHR